MSIAAPLEIAAHNLTPKKYFTTYLVNIVIQSPGQYELERALIELAKKYPLSWQMGPREVNVTAVTAKVAAETPPRDD
jgi:hypothetical protein